jgi:protein gp37
LLKPSKLNDPYRWKEPKRVFVNSMSDLFHESMPDEYLRQIFNVMEDLPRHRFQVLTKRPERAAKWNHWPSNVWMGATVEDNKASKRIEAIRSCGAAVKFLSIEPLIEDIKNPDIAGIDWVIVGGESGPHLGEEKWRHRFMDHAWARSIRDAAIKAGAAFFFKQSSGYKTELGVALEHEDGSFWLWQQYPDLLRPPVMVPHQINGRDIGRYITESYAEQIFNHELGLFN